MLVLRCKRLRASFIYALSGGEYSSQTSAMGGWEAPDNLGTAHVFNRYRALQADRRHHRSTKRGNYKMHRNLRSIVLRRRGSVNSLIVLPNRCCSVPISL